MDPKVQKLWCVCAIEDSVVCRKNLTPYPLFYFLFFYFSGTIFSDKKREKIDLILLETEDFDFVHISRERKSVSEEPLTVTRDWPFCFFKKINLRHLWVEGLFFVGGVAGGVLYMWCNDRGSRGAFICCGRYLMEMDDEEIFRPCGWNAECQINA